MLVLASMLRLSEKQLSLRDMCTPPRPSTHQSCKSPPWHHGLCMASMGKEANGSLLAVDATLSCMRLLLPLLLLLPLTWDGSCDALLLVAVPSVSSPQRSCPNPLDEVHG